MKELILERNPIGVMHVVKPLFIPVHFKTMKESILVKCLMSVNSVRKPSDSTAPFKRMRKLMLRVKSRECKQFLVYGHTVRKI